MSATSRLRRDRGTALIVVTMLATTVLALCVLTLSSSITMSRTATSRLASSKAFYVAEGGMDYILGQIATDPFWPARSTAIFPTVGADDTFQSGWIALGAHGGEFQIQAAFATANKVPSTWTGAGFPSGFAPFTNVSFADRATSKPRYDRINVHVTGRYDGRSSWVQASLNIKTTLYGGAIVSDAAPVAGTGSGKSLAINNDAIVFDTDRNYVYGGLRANNTIYVGGTSLPLTSANAAAELAGWDGAVRSGLYGTPSEIPDYTSPGAGVQLFDFGRFRAAAAAGAGAVYDNLSSFAAAVRASNAAGAPLEGIIYVNVDPSVEGNGPKLTTATSGLGCGTAGINVRGTLVFHFINPPDNFYKIFGEAPLHINAGANDATFDPTDPATFKTGYPPVLSAAKDPANVDITPAGYPNFQSGDDYPALMFDNGTVDIHQECNICGVTYTPTYMEVENKHNALQYFNGSIITGGGIYFESGGSPGAQVMVFDEMAVDSMPTFDMRGYTPSISVYSAGR